MIERMFGIVVPSGALGELASRLFRAITGRVGNEAVSRWMEPWVIQMYSQQELGRLPELLSSYSSRNWWRLAGILDKQAPGPLSTYLDAPVILAVFERLSARGLWAAHVWKQALGTTDDLEELTARLAAGL